MASPLRCTEERRTWFSGMTWLSESEGSQKPVQDLPGMQTRADRGSDASTKHTYITLTQTKALTRQNCN